MLILKKMGKIKLQPKYQLKVLLKTDLEIKQQLLPHPGSGTRFRKISSELGENFTISSHKMFMRPTIMPPQDEWMDLSVEQEDLKSHNISPTSQSPESDNDLTWPQIMGVAKGGCENADRVIS